MTPASPLSAQRRGHPSAWLAWTAGAASAALLIRNPWYLLILGGVAIAVRWRATRHAPARSTFLLLATLILTSTLVNVLFSRAGETVLLDLPIGWLGGPYTLEAALFGVSAGLQISAVLLVMLVFGSVVTPADLLRRTPPGLYPVGVTSMLALTFAPLARRSYQELSEARRLRGWAPRGVHEARASVEPLVILSLERAVAQAEALVARGWSASTPGGGRRALGQIAWVALAAGLGLWAVVPDQPGFGLGLIVLALLMLMIGVRRTGARYRPESWAWPDRALFLLSAAAMVVLLLLMTRSPGLLTYYPYPRISLPGLHPAPLVVLALLTAPVFTQSDD
jgi:energy-coupling factor transport system permease protein